MRIAPLHQGERPESGSLILDLAAEVDRFRCVTNYQGAEADASRNLWAISNALVHTARLILHRARAFPDRPIFIDDYCDYLAIGPNQSSELPRDFRLSTARIAEINALFPFTQQESVQICFHSALIISRITRRLSAPNPMYSDTAELEVAIPWLSRRTFSSPRSIPYMACCQFQSFCVLATVLWRVLWRCARAAWPATHTYSTDPVVRHWCKTLSGW